MAVAAAGWVPGSIARHALTVGGLGVVTLGMMARVSLGHTGRPMQPDRWVEASFLVLNVAAALRVFGPLLAPERYALWVELSAGLWVLTFLMFLAYYAPMLLRPRPDGQPG